MKAIKSVQRFMKVLGAYHLETYAASASFFAFTSLFPLLMLTLFVVSHTASGTEMFLEAIGMILPEAVYAVLYQMVVELQETSVVSLSCSLLAIIWTASNGMMGLMAGLNSIAGVEDHRNFLLKRLMCSLFMVLLMLGLLVTLALRVFGNSILSLFQQYLPYVGRLFSMMMEFRGGTLFWIIALTIALIYCFFPHRKMRFLAQLPGAFFASATWLLFSELYSFYIEHIFSTISLYGSMGAVVMAMLWLYFCMYIIFVGAVINQAYSSVKGRSLMRKSIKLKPQGLSKLRDIDPRMMSYHIEMAEVTGGTFWKAYTPEQTSGEKKCNFSAVLSKPSDIAALMQQYPPIDLKSEKLRMLARALGPVWVRVSGTWATKTYYDLEDSTGGEVPAGYESVLTKAQWTGLLDFIRAVGGKLLVSVSNCAGDHPNGGPLNLTQAKKLFTFSREYGVLISAAEFMNQPNGLAMGGAPEGYTPADYARDQDIFCAWVRENEPDCLLVGPCTTGDPTAIGDEPRGFGAAVAIMTNACTTAELLEGTKVPLDVFSYHFYNGVSERLAPAVPSAHWPAELAYTDEYLAAAPNQARIHAALRDRFVPGAPLWLTESGDAGGGGNTWASTYLDVFRTLNELGSYATISDGVIFHNTLASSDYGFLEHGSFDPRPNYYAVLLWNWLMGTKVYDCSHLAKENLHIYCHSRRDGREGYAFLIINNSLTEEVSIELSGDAARYTLTADSLRAPAMRLNGKELVLSEKNELPALKPVMQSKGKIALPSASSTFLIL